MAEKKMRKLLVHTHDQGELCIEIPASYKITFGPLSNRGYEGGNALRVYESDKQQRACFVNVVSFRDLSIPVQRKVKQRREKVKTESDSEGNSLDWREVKVDDGQWEDG